MHAALDARERMLHGKAEGWARLREEWIRLLQLPVKAMKGSGRIQGRIQFWGGLPDPSGFACPHTFTFQVGLRPFDVVVFKFDGTPIEQPISMEAGAD